MSDFIPNGYQPISEWLDGEKRRQALVNSNKSLSQAELAVAELAAKINSWRAFDDLANHLGQEESHSAKMALCITDDGRIQEIPLEVWRQKPTERAGIAFGKVEFRDPLGRILCRGRVVIKTELRLKGSPVTAVETITVGMQGPDAETVDIAPDNERTRRKTTEQRALQENKIKTIIAKAKSEWPDPTKAPGAKPMSEQMHAAGKTEGLSIETTRQILEGRYRPQKKLKIRGYFR